MFCPPGPLCGLPWCCLAFHMIARYVCAVLPVAGRPGGGWVARPRVGRCIDLHAGGARRSQFPVGTCVTVWLPHPTTDPHSSTAAPRLRCPRGTPFSKRGGRHVSQCNHPSPRPMFWALGPCAAAGSLAIAGARFACPQSCHRLLKAAWNSQPCPLPFDADSPIHRNARRKCSSRPI